jgi:hypothetical protein
MDNNLPYFVFVKLYYQLEAVVWFHPVEVGADMQYAMDSPLHCYSILLPLDKCLIIAEKQLIEFN